MVLTLLEQNDRAKLARTVFLAGFRPPCAASPLLRVGPFIIARRHSYGDKLPLLYQRP